MKKKIVSILVIAVMALAVGCGNSGQTTTTAKSITVQSKNSAAKSSAAKSQGENAAYNMGGSKNQVTFSGFTEGDYTFSDMVVKYPWDGNEGFSAVSFTVTYNGSSERYVEKLWFSLCEYEFGDLDAIVLKKTLVPGESIDISDHFGRDLIYYNKIKFVGDTEP